MQDGRAGELFDPLPWPEREGSVWLSGLYFVQAESGHIKIGRTCDMRARLQALQAFCPLPVRLVGWVQLMGHDLERHLHGVLRASHSHSEWFLPTPAVCEIVGLARTVDVDEFARYVRALPEVPKDRQCRRGHGAIGPDDRTCRKCAVLRQQRYAARKAASPSLSSGEVGR